MSNGPKSKRTKAARRARRPAQSTAPTTPTDLGADSVDEAVESSPPAETPQTPDTPETPATPETPDLPETPEAPDLPETPETEPAPPVEAPPADDAAEPDVAGETTDLDEPGEPDEPTDADERGDPPADEPHVATDAQDTSARSWRRLGRAASPRPTKANVLATVLALGLGFAIAAQVRQTSIEGLEDLREDELIRILDTVNQDGARLADELQTLRFSRDRLENDTTSLTEQRDAAQQRLDSLGILSGTVAAAGPGIILTISDPENRVTAPLLLDTLQELRDAGAEAVEINGNRIVANTFFTDTEGGVEISGQAVKAPFEIHAIGDPATLAPAMDIPGGVSESVRTLGGQARIDTRDEVSVTALRSVSEPQYARPVPSPTKS